jgi:hypothetical protein
LSSSGPKLRDRFLEAFAEGAGVVVLAIAMC